MEPAACRKHRTSQERGEGHSGAQQGTKQDSSERVYSELRGTWRGIDMIQNRNTGLWMDDRAPSTGRPAGVFYTAEEGARAPRGRDGAVVRGARASVKLGIERSIGHHGI